MKDVTRVNNLAMAEYIVAHNGSCEGFMRGNEVLHDMTETKITINTESLTELLATIEDEIEVNSIIFEIPSKKWSCLDDLRKMIKMLKGGK